MFPPQLFTVKYFLRLFHSIKLSSLHTSCSAFIVIWSLAVGPGSAGCFEFPFNMHWSLTNMLIKVTLNCCTEHFQFSNTSESQIWLPLHYEQCLSLYPMTLGRPSAICSRQRSRRSRHVHRSLTRYLIITACRLLGRIQWCMKWYSSSRSSLLIRQGYLRNPSVGKRYTG